MAMFGAVIATSAGVGGAADKLTFHNTPDRTGTNDAEVHLTPAVVGGAQFGEIWQSPRLDPAPDNVQPRLFASPLYLSGVAVRRGGGRIRPMPLAFVATTAGYAYAIHARSGPGTKAGDILWRKRLTPAPCAKGTMGNLATPVIDPARGRIYVTSCSGDGWTWQVHALDLATGAELAGWPLTVDAAGVNRAGVSRNGAKRWSDGQIAFQRGALNLNGDGSRLYVAFGPDPQGWLLSIDTAARRIDSAFSSTAAADEEQGGMWGASGASVDRQGRVHIATGANFSYTLAKRGIPGVFPDSAHSWGQSILQFDDRPGQGLRLIGTYTPYNYCQTAASDIDIGGSGAVLLDLGTPRRRLLALGAGKQGNAYLLDRDHMPGSTVKRQACSTDPTSDGSLLAPEVQQPLGSRGPVNVFGPFSDSIGMTNQAKSRSTLAWLHDGQGRDWLFLTGSSKTGPDYSTNVPPGLVRVRVVTLPTQAPFLRLGRAEMTQTLQNPGSPVVSSNRGRSAIVWVLDPNAPRSVDLFAADAPGAMLYAFDAMTLRLIWKSGKALYPTGKYNEPAVVDGMVLVGTDRLQAFGLRAGKGGGARTGAVRTAPPAAAAPQAQAISRLRTNSRSLFDATCAGCHAAGAGGAPTTAALRQMPRARVVEALTTGKMAAVVGPMPPDQVSALADYLSPGAAERR